MTVIPQDIAMHQHVGLIYDRNGEQLALAAEFLSAGIRDHQFCFYVHDESTSASVLRALRSAGVDTDCAIAGGRLALADKTSSFLAGGRFVPEEMLAMLQGAVDGALAAGLTGVRATGEMCWALGPHPGVEELMQYEALCNHFIERNPIAGVCMFNRSRFDEEALRNVIRTHPYLVVQGTLCRNFYYVPAEQYLAGDLDPNLDVDQILTGVLRREVAERTLASAELMIEGGAFGDSVLVDARRLSGIYSELVRYKEDLLERNRRRVQVLGARAGAEDRASVTRQEGELDAMVQRQTFWEGRRQQLIGVDYDAELSIVHYLGRSVRLSRREGQLLTALMARVGRSIPARELVLKAWGSTDLSEAQLRSYVVQLRKKLALIELPASLVNAPRVGYSMVFDPANLRVVEEPTTEAV